MVLVLSSKFSEKPHAQHSGMGREKYDKELEQFKVNITKELEQFKTNITAQGLREERIRKEIIRWANPILGAVQELNNRLDNILNKCPVNATRCRYLLDLLHEW